MSTLVSDPENLKVAELRDALQQRGLETKGNKAALVIRLREALGSSVPAVDTDAGSWAAPPSEHAQPLIKNQPKEENMEVEDVAAGPAGSAVEGEVVVTGDHPRMMLNQKLGHPVEFDLIKDEGPADAKEYTVKLVVQAQEFYGIGRSQKLAKTNASEKALLAIYKIKFDPALRPAPAVAQKRKAGAVGETEMNSNVAVGPAGSTVDEGEFVVTGDHPRLMLNQKLGSAVEFDLIKDEGQANAKEYTVKMVAQGQEFYGIGRSQKLAKTNASEKALLEIFKIKFDPDLRPAAQKRKNVAVGETGFIEDIPGDDEVNSKRRMEQGSVKKRKMMVTKNALMHLNELKPGSKFEVTQEETIKGQTSVFRCTVEVNGQTFEGRSNSKKGAKQVAAEIALKSFVQFPDASEAHQALGRGFLPHSADFTSDANLDQAVTFNPFGQGNAPLVPGTSASAYAKTMRRMSGTETPTQKNPVQVLNEIHRGVTYELAGEVGERNFRLFSMKVTVGTREFVGQGRSKKLAKNNAALQALKTLHGINHFARRDMTAVNDDMVSGDPQALADHVAQLVFNKFGELTDNFSSAHARRKVLAGIVMTTEDDSDTGTVLCVATGTKCINGEHLSSEGTCVNDCHAEVLCRRLLVRYLYAQLRLHLDPTTAKSSTLERHPDGGFSLRQGVKFHLYISTSPCGDSRIFSPHDKPVKTKAKSKPGEGGDAPPAPNVENGSNGDSVMETDVKQEVNGAPNGGGDKHPNRRARGLLRTKIESGEGTIPVKVGGSIQTWDGVLQGERLLTMSCSDKISRWNVLGMQGSLLSNFLRPVYLSSVIVGSWYHSEHMVRGLYQRLAHVELPTTGLYRLNKPFLSGISSPECRQPGKTPNFSVNWCVGDESIEVVNPFTGKTTEKDEASRLCKQALFKQFLQLYGKVSSLIQNSGTAQPKLYSEAKAAVNEYQLTKESLVQAFKVASLGNWVNKPQEHDQFGLIEDL